MPRVAKSMTSLRSKKKNTQPRLPREYDKKYTGEEPKFFGWEKWSIDEYEKMRRRVTLYYNYHHSAKDLVKYIIEWMKMSKYTKAQITAFRNSNHKMLSTAVGIYCAARVNGMPSVHPYAKETIEKNPGLMPTAFRPVDKFIKKELDLFLKGPYRAEIYQAEKKEDKTVKPSPINLLKMKVDATVMAELDEWVEDNFHNTKNFEKFNIFECLQTHSIPANGLKPIRDFISGLHEEIEGSVKKTDPQLVEGYSHMPVTHRKKMVKIMAEMLADIDKYQLSKKAVRKPRVSKPKSAMKQIEKLKYLKEDNTHKLASVNPMAIIGAQRVYTFNVKNRAITEYVSERPAGFEIRGTSLVGFDQDKSRTTRLRKPDEFLPIVMKKTEKQIDKAWKGLTTKTAQANARFNEHTIILRVL